jgi:hypothetical protein
MRRPIRCSASRPGRRRARRGRPGESFWAACGKAGPDIGGPVHNSGGYHFPSDANHHPGPCEVSLMSLPLPA